PPHPTATPGEHPIRRSALSAGGRSLRQFPRPHRASRPYARWAQGAAAGRAGANRLRLSRRLQLLVLTTDRIGIRVWLRDSQSAPILTRQPSWRLKNELATDAARPPPS